ncbi:hypothetical protein LQW54_001617 [Pestalotiopsis sp. IQ-011]
MKLLTTVAVSLLGFGKHTVAQGFMGNCTWRGANLTGTFLGMYCQDENVAVFENQWTWHDLNHCLANNNGSLAPMASGGYEGSCRDCHLLVETHRWMNLTCNCFDISDDLIPSQYDLNQVLYNHNGSLGCFDFLGNKSHCGPMCEPGYHQPAFTTPLPSNAKRTASATHRATPVVVMA